MSRRRGSERLAPRGLLVALVVALVLTASVATASVPAADGRITGCWHPKLTTLRVIDPGTGQRCFDGEKQLSWGATSTLRSGAGAPPAASGNPGDFYLDVTATALYGPKTTAGWPASATSLIGAPGSPGAAGAVGPAGPAGPKGDPGSLETAVGQPCRVGEAAQGIWAWHDETDGSSLRCVRSVSAVALGADGSMLTSAQGAAWFATPPTGAPNVPSKIVWFPSGQRWVAVGTSGDASLTSVDGISWTPIVESGVGGRHLFVDGDRLLAFNDNVTGDIVASDATGLIWHVVGSTASIPKVGAIQAVVPTAAGWEVVVAGDANLVPTFYRSTDLSTWTAVDVPIETTLILRESAGVPGRSIVVGDHGTVLSSSDGLTWQVVYSDPAIFQLSGVAFNGSQWLAVGPSNKVLTSSDGVTWTARDVAMQGAGRSPVWTGSRWLAIGGRGIWASTDAQAWTLTGTNAVALVSLAAKTSI